MESQEPAFQTALQPQQQQQPPRTAPTQQMTMSPDIYGYAAAGGTEETDEYEEGGCNCAKTVFYIGLVASALMVFWFCVLRVPMSITPCPFQVTFSIGGTTKTLPVSIADKVFADLLKAMGRAQPKEVQDEKEAELQYGCDGMLESVGVSEFLALINRRGEYGASKLSNLLQAQGVPESAKEAMDALMNLQSYTIHFTTSGFLIDAAQTIVVVIACIALAPAVKCKVFKLLAMTCFIGIGLAFLIEVVQAVITIIFYFIIIGGANDMVEAQQKVIKEAIEMRERSDEHRPLSPKEYLQNLQKGDIPIVEGYSSDLVFLIFRFLQMAVELILAVLLILVAFLTCKAYSNELLTTSSNNNNGGANSSGGQDGGGYQPYMGPAVVQQNDKSKMRTYTQLEGIM